MIYIIDQISYLTCKKIESAAADYKKADREEKRSYNLAFACQVNGAADADHNAG
jgi:hypothetical protein